MDLATPFLICAEHEDFRALLRDMLTKNGFFHVVEAANSEELMDLVRRERKPHFVLVQAPLINDRLLPELLGTQRLVIITSADASAELPLIARFGVARFLSFPFSAQRLLEKIETIAQ